MAKQISAFRFTGTLGNIVGSKGLDGKVIVREKAASVANPQTEAQMDQRAKMKLAAKVAGMLGEVGQLALKANGFKATRRGTLIKDLLEKITVSNNIAELPRQLALVKNPMAVALPSQVTATVSGDATTLTGTITGLPLGTVTAKALLIYNPATEDWQQVSSLDVATSLSIGVQNAADYDIYFYVELVLPTTSEGRAKLDNLLGVTPGYKVAVNRLDATNYGYSRTLNAGRVNGVVYSDSIAASPEAIIETNLGNIGRALNEIIEDTLAVAAQNNNVTVHQEFINQNRAAYADANYDFADFAEAMILSEGNRAPVSLGEASFSTPRRVTVPIENGDTDSPFGDVTDKVILVVYNDQRNLAVMSDGSTTRADSEVKVDVPREWQGEYVYAYAYVQKANDPTDCSETIWAGTGTVA